MNKFYIIAKRRKDNQLTNNLPINVTYSTTDVCPLLGSVVRSRHVPHVESFRRDGRAGGYLDSNGIGSIDGLSSEHLFTSIIWSEVWK